LAYIAQNGSLATSPPATAAGNYLIAFTSALNLDFLGIERGGIFVIRPDGTGLRQLTQSQTSQLRVLFSAWPESAG
jgi:hypothetical protein